ncbi:MAG: MBOAT family protein [Planctomycetota bacterium]
MLFNSYPFIYLFLPVTLLLFFVVGRFSRTGAVGCLVTCSLCFYASWNPDPSASWSPRFLLLILASIGSNFALGRVFSRQFAAGRTSKPLLVLGLAFNLCLLGYFKYANFFVDNVNAMLGATLDLDPVILPLAISFFTFQQVAYLLDTYQGKTEEHGFAHYCLFVTFFPQLIAGPIVHHKEMLPQFQKSRTYCFSHENLAVGATIFLFGLCKKVFLADTFAEVANPAFDQTAAGGPSLVGAWAGTVAYTLQLYFDFSGYSDMAIGLGRLFGIRLPLNFNSPYKACNIIDFWRRWHMTLSRFLRDYLYFPLGGGRRGKGRRYVNLMITMLLGGLWHGAGWTFVAWGALHGFYLLVNHAWRSMRDRVGAVPVASWWRRELSRAATLFAVMMAWVFFRADDFGAAASMFQSLFGMTGIGSREELIASFPWLLVGLVLALWAPNTQQILQGHSPALETRPGEVAPNPWPWLVWQPSALWALGMLCGFVIGMVYISDLNEFLYFQF